MVVVEMLVLMMMNQHRSPKNDVVIPVFDGAEVVVSQWLWA